MLIFNYLITLLFLSWCGYYLEIRIAIQIQWDMTKLTGDETDGGIFFFSI